MTDPTIGERPVAPEADAIDKTLAFSTEEYQERLRRLQAILAEHDVDCIVSTMPENLTYISGYQTPGYYKWQALIVPTSGSPRVVCRGFEAMNVRAWSWFDDVVPIQEHHEPMEVTARALAEMGLSNKRIGVELDSWFITNRQLAELKRLTPGSEWVDVSGSVERLRMIKSPAEVEHIRTACGYAQEMMRAGIEAVTVGANERDVAEAVLGTMGKVGCEPAGIAPFIVSGPRTGIPHATWSDREIVAGDPVMMEIPGSRFRYCGPILRTPFAGEINQKFQRVADVCIEALEAILSAARPGVPGSSVDQAMQDVCAEAGLLAGATHRAGYSVGVNWSPDWGEGQIIDLSPREEKLLEPGMTFHCPGPMLFVGAHAIGISETILITEGGCETLTDMPREFPVRE
jgi:Xaa-Pro dipeptidase